MHSMTKSIMTQLAATALIAALLSIAIPPRPVRGSRLPRHKAGGGDCRHSGSRHGAGNVSRRVQVEPQDRDLPGMRSAVQAEQQEPQVLLKAVQREGRSRKGRLQMTPSPEPIIMGINNEHKIEQLHAKLEAKNCEDIIWTVALVAIAVGAVVVTVGSIVNAFPVDSMEVW